MHQACISGWTSDARFPFPDGSVDLAHSEHFLEHLDRREGEQHLSEVHRILKPGGRYRVVVPAGIRFIERYLAGDDEFFTKAFPWADRPMQAVHDILYFAGAHKNVFDRAELQHLGARAGFEAVIETEANQSDIPALNIDVPDSQRVAESLYVEFIKSSQ